MVQAPYINQKGELMNITVIGAGYVGLTTSLAFAEQGHNVVVVESDQAKLSLLHSSILPFYEEGMEDLLKKHKVSSKLHFTKNPKEAIEQSELLFITVGTPPRPNGTVDLSYIEGVAREIGTYLHDYRVIVIKSTVPVGTAEKIVQIIKEHLPKSIEFDVVSNPEFLREGNALYDALHPDRIIVGCETARAKEHMEKLYNDTDAPILFTTRRDAEMIKYASNAFLAMKISFMNELARVSERLGVNIANVAKGMGSDPRIGPDFLRAGIGYGGSCFPKDTSALLAMSSEIGMSLKIVEATIEVNETQVRWFLEKIVRALGTLEGKRIGILGLTFKPKTDDIREAMSLKLIEQLLTHKAVVSAYDPKGLEAVQRFFPQVQYATEPLQALNNVDATVVVTEWDEIVHLNWKEAKNLVRQPYLFDGRNALEPKLMEELGFNYEGVGIARKGNLDGKS